MPYLALFFLKSVFLFDICNFKTFYVIYLCSSVTYITLVNLTAVKKILNYEAVDKFGLSRIGL